MEVICTTRKIIIPTIMTCKCDPDQKTPEIRRDAPYTEITWKSVYTTTLIKLRSTLLSRQLSALCLHYPHSLEFSSSPSTCPGHNYTKRTGMTKTLFVATVTLPQNVQAQSHNRLTEPKIVRTPAAANIYSNMLRAHLRPHDYTEMRSNTLLFTKKSRDHTTIV